MRLREPSGRLTEAGKVFFPAGAPLPFDHTQDPLQVGRSEYIRMYDGSRKRTRRMVGGKWTHFTQTGRDFYKQNQQTFILGVPAIKQVAHRDGTLALVETQLMSDAVPGIGRLSVPRILGEVAKHAFLRDAALKLISALPDTPDGKVLLEDSVTYFYNPDGEWRFDEQQVEFDAEGPTVESILNRRLFGTPFVSADIFAPWGRHSASFLDAEGECIAVQLAALGFCNGNVEHVRHQFDAIFPKVYPRKDGSPYEDFESWRGHGVIAKMIEEFARLQGVTFYMLWNNTVIKPSVVPGVRKHREVLAMCISGDHGFFYEDSNVKKAIAKMNVRDPRTAPTSRLEVEAPSEQMEDQDPYDKWRFVTEACQLEAPGHYLTSPDALDSLRADLIGHNYPVKVHMRDVMNIRALSVSQKEGKYVVHVQPSHASEMSQWSCELKHQGFHVPTKVRLMLRMAFRC